MLEINDRWQAERVSRTCLAHARAHAARTRSRCVHAHAPTYTVNRYKLTYVKRLLLRRSVTIHYPRVLYGVTRLRFATGGPHDPAPYGIDKFLRGRCRIAEGTRVYHARTRARTRKGTEKIRGTNVIVSVIETWIVTELRIISWNIHFGEIERSKFSRLTKRKFRFAVSKRMDSFEKFTFPRGHNSFYISAIIKNQQ